LVERPTIWSSSSPDQATRREFRYLWRSTNGRPRKTPSRCLIRGKVTVRKKGRTVTVTRSFTKLVDEDFTWKDRRRRKSRHADDGLCHRGHGSELQAEALSCAFRAADAGLSPGIPARSAMTTSVDRKRPEGGDGQVIPWRELPWRLCHGLAADIVSVKGATRAERWTATESLWKWIDAHGNEFGIGRPYLDRDPPHLAPTDGKEYAAHRGTKSSTRGIAY